MIALGILFAGATICTFLAAIYGEEEYKRLFAFLCGVFLILSVNTLISPFFEETNQKKFTVRTKVEAVVEKEIFINTKGKSDTTYYYKFEECSIMKND